MGDAAPRLRMTPEEYLAFERASEQKHEYVDGEIFAMSGGTRKHSLLAGNVNYVLNLALRSRPCEVYTSDMKVRSGKEPEYHYPDASVVCGQPIFEDETEDVLLNPKVIVEVLSKSTQRYDRGDKFDSYGTIASLVEYVLISQMKVRVEHYRRGTDGTWIYRKLGPGEVLVLPSIGCEILVDEIYRKVFPVQET
jgi:Uma2 family endonuclease